MNNSKKSKRPGSSRRGRPLAEDNTDYRQQILDSAESLFAEVGFDSVSMKEIAAPVGVNPAMIHYYFGSKRKLLEEVLESALEPLAAAISSLRQRDDPNIEEFADHLFSTLRQHPNLPLLLMRQVLLPGSPMQAHFIDKLAPRLGGALPHLLGQAQKSGRVAADLDPRIAALMVLSLCVFPQISRPLSQPALGIAFDQDGMVKLQKHVIRFIQGGLRSS